MFFERLCGSEAFLAAGTFVGLLLALGLLMVLEGGAAGETSPAVGAGEGFLFQMDPLMPAEGRTTTEAFPTLAAGVLVLPQLYS